MSKAKLKKELQQLTKEQLIEQVLELYDSYKPVKEYYTMYLNPENEKELCEKYKAIIINEFYPKNKNADPQLRFSVAKKAIADFNSLKPSPELIADLMMTLVEVASQFTFDYGDMWGQYYDSTISNFERVLKYLKKEELLEKFRPQCERCLIYAEDCGWGFLEGMEIAFYKYYF